MQNDQRPEPQPVTAGGGPFEPGKVFPKGSVGLTIRHVTVEDDEIEMNRRAHLDAEVEGETGTSHLEATLAPIFEKALERPEWPKKYHVEIVDEGPGGTIEGMVFNDRGEVTFHDLDHTDFTPHWASVELVTKISEALIRAIEGT